MNSPLTIQLKEWNGIEGLANLWSLYPLTADPIIMLFAFCHAVHLFPPFLALNFDNKPFDVPLLPQILSYSTSECLQLLWVNAKRKGINVHVPMCLCACRFSGPAAAHAPLATVSLATLVRRRVRRQLNRVWGFSQLWILPFPCKAERDLGGRGTCFRSTHQRQEICRHCRQGRHVGVTALVLWKWQNTWNDAYYS